MKKKDMAPIHPGTILLEEFLKPMDISQYRLAKDTSVPARRINEIVHGKRSITAERAMDQKVNYINQDKSLIDALDLFVSTKKPMCVVVDENKKTAGLVTLSDVIDALFGRKIAN